jgi:hypothetical protein
MFPSGSLVFSAMDDMRQVPTMSQHGRGYTLMVGSDISGAYTQPTSSFLQLSIPKAAEGNKLRAENGQQRADAYMSSEGYDETAMQKMEKDPSDDQIQKLQTLKEDPSDGQIKTFQQRAWSSKEFQIDLHEWVAEMLKLRLIDERDEKTLYHGIHQRDRDIIKAIIEIATIGDSETCTDEKSKKKKLANLLTNLKETLIVFKDSLKTALADVKPFLSARLPFKRASRKRTAHILQLPGEGDEEDIFNPKLVRYFVENVWKLERPDVIISVTGGASKNFGLRSEHKETLMRGMMDGTRKLKTWSVSIYVCICFLSV